MSKYVGVGFTLKMSTAGSSTFGVTIGQVRSISGPAKSADVIDVTTQDSTNNYREKAVGFLDGGDVSLGVMYDPALSSHAELNNMLDGRVLGRWQVIYPTTTVTKEFAGYVSGLSPEVPFGAEVTADVTIAVSGKPVFPTST